VHNELAENSQDNMETVIVRSVGTSFFVYQLIGVVGYLTFGKYVSSNIIAQCNFI
jgi:amino acid permease